MKSILSIIGVVVILMVGGAWWSKSLQSKDPEGVATNGIHWHPKLMIYVKGEPFNIPSNIGLAGTHQPIHTHDDLPIIHLEFGGRVTKSDVQLGKFFRSWGKDFTELGKTVRMTVNGEENTEFENYEMKDGDNIELRYE